MKSIQLPDELYPRAAELAKAISVDRPVAALVNEGVDDWERVQARAEPGSLEKLKRVLAKISDALAEAADRL